MGESLAQIGATSGVQIKRRSTRTVQVGDLVIGSSGPISVQSMCATKTQDLVATAAQIALLEQHGADIIRIAIDSRRDVEALAEKASKGRRSVFNHSHKFEISTQQRAFWHP